jgi:hypothetical protein
MKIYKFKATLIEDDERTGYKKDGLYNQKYFIIKKEKLYLLEIFQEIVLQDWPFLKILLMLK